MEKVVNEWNMNMNTLNMAVVEEDEQTVWGFVFGKTQPEVRVYSDGNECAREWFNCHCQGVECIGRICKAVVLSSAFTEAWLHQFEQDLYNSVVHDLEKEACIGNNNDFASMVERASFIWNERCSGGVQDVLSPEVLASTAYGLLYWEKAQMKAFFDNRLINTYDQMVTLHDKHIYPLWIKLEKKTFAPILVRDGCQKILEMGNDAQMKAIYEKMQVDLNK